MMQSQQQPSRWNGALEWSTGMEHSSGLSFFVCREPSFQPELKLPGTLSHSGTTGMQEDKTKINSS